MSGKIFVFCFFVLFSSSSLTHTHRVSALESVHEDALNTLGAKLGEVEDHLINNHNAENLMGQIASKFTLLESRIQSQSNLGDRIAKLESKLSLHSDLHGRINHLESKLPTHSILSDRVSRVEAQLRPDPEHDRLVSRINAKLDMIENTQRMKLGSNAGSTSTRAPAGKLRSSADNDEIRFIQDRVDKLTALRARYAKEEKELMD